jgi:hypothetical protein
MQILVVVQDVNNIYSYSLHLIKIMKNKHRIIKVESVENIARLTVKSIANSIVKMIKKYDDISMVISPIPKMIRVEKIESIYQPRIGQKSQENQGYMPGRIYEEGLAISYYMELLPLIQANGAAYDSAIGSAIFVDDGAKVNTYRLNHYEVQPLTLAFMYAIYYTYKRRVEDVLIEMEEIRIEELNYPLN